MASAVEEATRKTLASLWERNLPILRERVEEIERVASAAAAGRLTPEARKSAGGTAHKLAGSLGMFGYPQGTVIARELEQILEGATAELNVPRLGELAHALRTEVPL